MVFFMVAEDHAIVLDYLPSGKSNSFKENPLAQVIGTEFFTLLEVVPKAELKPFEKVYIGPEARDKISFIKRRIQYNELTSNSVSELQNVVEKVVEENLPRFVNFYNNCGAITIRRHQLELLPGIGKKHVLNILNEREIKQFESFEDMDKRLTSVPNPKKAVVKRIMQELMGEDDPKHFLFVRKPAQESEFK